MYLSWNKIAYQTMKLVSFAEKQIMRLVSELDLNLYNIIYDNDTTTSVIYNSLIYKYCKIYILKSEHAYHLRCNSHIINHKPSDGFTQIYQRVYLQKGNIINYFDKEYVFEHNMNRYKRLKAEMLFINQINFSSIIKSFFFSYDITAKELCNVLGQHTTRVVSIIDSSLDEMIFKDTMSMYF
jgi:hypothetical protein